MCRPATWTSWSSHAELDRLRLHSAVRAERVGAISLHPLHAQPNTEGRLVVILFALFVWAISTGHPFVAMFLMLVWLCDD